MTGGPEMKYEIPQWPHEGVKTEKKDDQKEGKINAPYKEKLDKKFENKEWIQKAFSDVTKEYDATKIEWYITKNFNKKSDADPLRKKLENVEVDSPEYMQAIWDLRVDMEFYFDNKESKNISVKEERKEIKEEAKTTVEVDYEKEFDAIVKKFQDINEGKWGYKGLTRDQKQLETKKIFSENKNALESYFAIPALKEKKISAARSAPTHKENVYILQIFGKAYLSDDIVIDGIYGKQTEGVLRFAQWKWIWGKEIVNEQSKESIKKYEERYQQIVEKTGASAGQKKEEQANADSKEQKNKIDLSKKNVTGDALFKNNEGIGKFVLESGKDDVSVDSLPQSDKVYKKYISNTEYAWFLATAFSELGINNTKDQDAYAKCFDQQWNKKSDNQKLNKLSAVDDKVKEQTSKRCEEIKKELAINSNQILKKECAAWFINFVKSEIGEKFAIDFNSFDMQKDLEFPWKDNCLKMTAHVQWENDDVSDIDYRYYPRTGERSVTEIIHKNEGKGIEIDKTMNEQKLTTFPWPKWNDILDKGKAAIPVALNNANTLEQFKDNLSKKVSDCPVSKDPLAEKMIEKAWRKNHAMRKIIDVMWYDPKQIDVSSERRNGSMYKLFDMLYCSLNYYTADENKKFIALTEEFKNDVLLKYNNPKFEDKNNEKEFGTMAFRKEKMEYDKKNLNNNENINSFYAFFSPMVENKKSIADPRYNVISLDKTKERWSWILNYEHVLQSFKTPWENALLKVESSRWWKEIEQKNKERAELENIENTYFNTLA